jgi:hypothetical protein
LWEVSDKFVPHAHNWTVFKRRRLGSEFDARWDISSCDYPMSFQDLGHADGVKVDLPERESVPR